MNTKTKKKSGVAALFFVAIAAYAGNERGIDLYRAELYEAAKLELKAQTNQSPTEQAENQYYLGETYFALQQLDSAKACYTQAVASDPNYPFGYVGEGKIALKQVSVNDAKDLFKKAAGLAPKKDASVHTAIAEVYIDAKMFADADASLTKAEKADKKDSERFLALAALAVQQGKPNEANGWYEQALYFNPDDKVANLKLAKVYRYSNPTAAMDYLNKLISIDPEYIPAYALIGDINRSIGNYGTALSAYEKFISIPGVPIQQYEYYAQLLYFTKQYEQSLSQIDFVLSKDPNNQVMLRIKAYDHYELGNTALAVQELKTLLEVMPKEKHIYLDYITYGRALMKEKQSEEAIAALVKASELEPEKAEVFKELADAYESVKNYPEAIKAYEQYMALEPNVPSQDYYYFGVAVYTAASQYIDENYKASVTPEQLQADEIVFDGLIAKGDSAFSTFMQRMPDSYIGYVWKANLYSLVDAKRQESPRSPLPGVAKPYYESALEFMLNNNPEGKRNKDIVRAYNYLKSYYLLNDDTANAAKYCNEILAIEPDNADAKYLLSELAKLKKQ